MEPVTIKFTKRVMMEVPNGELKLIPYTDSYGRCGWNVEYHHDIFVNSPFKMTMSFSDEYTVDEIVNSPEVKSFVSRITGE